MGSLNIKAKTPIWTGNIDRKSDTVHLTGIMGSVRWWTETILRGMNKFVCDQTNDDENDPVRRCPIEKETDGKKSPSYCIGCLIFGATGLRRSFILRIKGGKPVFENSLLNMVPSGRSRGWYLGSGLHGDLKLEIVQLNRSFDDGLILLPIIIASKWGGIGAKTQHGYGVVEIENSVNTDFASFRDSLSKMEGLRGLDMALRSGSSTGLPDIRDFFFTKIRFEVKSEGWWKEVDGIKERGQRGNRDYYEGYVNDTRMINWVSSGSVPIAPAIKNWLRYGEGRDVWLNRNQKSIENWLFGTTNRVCQECFSDVRRDRMNRKKYWCPNCRKSIEASQTFDRVASKIAISSAYPVENNVWEFRIWGWIPRTTIAGFDREEFLNSLKRVLEGGDVPWNDLLGNVTENYNLIVWREFDSERDSVTKFSNIDDYIQSLLEDGR